MSSLLRTLDELAPPGKPHLFLSPHLDDAVLSCASLIGTLVARGRVIVASVFTSSAPPPHSRTALSVMRRCGSPDAGELYADRRREDAEVLRSLGAEHAHFGFVDAAFRQRRLLGRPALRRLTRMLPELTHRYPTYRFDIARGRVSSGDRAVLADVTEHAFEMARTTGAGTLYCPLGVGRHVDHLLVRDVGAGWPGPVVYYSDFPYNETFRADARFVEDHGLTAFRWDNALPDKERFIRGYGTQLQLLFPEDRIPMVPEVYYTVGAT